MCLPLSGSRISKDTQKVTDTLYELTIAYEYIRPHNTPGMKLHDAF